MLSIHNRNLKKMESYICFDNNNRRLYHNKKKGWYTENGEPTEVDFEELTLSVVCDLKGNRVKFIKKYNGFMPQRFAYIKDLLSTPQQHDYQSVVTVQNNELKKPQSTTKKVDFKYDGHTVPLRWADKIPANILAIIHATETFEKNGDPVLLSQNLKKALK